MPRTIIQLIGLLAVGLLAACNLSNTGRPRFITPTSPPGQVSEVTPESVTEATQALPTTTPLPVGITLTPLFAPIPSVGQVTGFDGIGLPQPGSSAIIFVGSDRLQARYQPGDEYGVVGTLNSFDQVEVIEGPQRAGAKTWWRVRFPGGEGWVPGLGQKEYQTLVPLEDFRFCSSSPIVVGGQADVYALDGALSLFSAPTTSAVILTEMPVHARVNVTGGAQTVGQNIWYGVRYTDSSGRPWDGYAVARSGNFCTLHPAS